MSGILIHDGRRSGHLRWSTHAVETGVADGAFLSPFSTPRIGAPRSPSADVFTKSVSNMGGEVIFDVETHARLLVSTDRIDHYDTWELWGSAGVGLDLPQRRLQHVERVFDRQTSLGTMLLAPTVTVHSPDDVSARHALATAEVGRALSPSASQSLVGSRAFWRSGYRLDEYVGQLAALRSPIWIITLANEMVMDQIPDLGDTEAIAGLLRSIHSLSERSRVIMTHSDFAGLLAVAAGADTVGSGWDRSMRVFDPASFHVSSEPGPRIAASVVTQAELSAVLRRDTAEAIERWNAALAETIRGGPMPPSDKAEREHHLRSVGRTISVIDAEDDRRERVRRARDHYSQSAAHFATLISALGSVVRPSDRTAWVDQQAAALEAYAAAEGL